MRIAPGTSDVVVVSMLNQEEVVAYAAGVELPERVAANQGPGRFIFTGPASLVGFDDATSGVEVFEFELDVNAGLSVIATHPGLGPGFDPAQLHLGSRDIFVDGGYAFNTELVARTNQLRQNDVSYTQTAIDLANNRLYALVRGFGQRTLEVYQESPLRQRSRFALGEIGGEDRDLLVGRDAIFLIMEGSVHRFPKSELEPVNAGNGCAPDDLSGLTTDSVYIQIDCAISDIVFDASRDRVYAALPTNLGNVANSIIGIDPQTGQSDVNLPLNLSPTKLYLAQGDSLLYVLGKSLTGYLRVDLSGTRDPDTFSAGYELINGGFRYQPYQPRGLVSSPTNSDRLALSFLGGDMALYDDGVRLPRVVDAFGQSSDLFFRTDGQVLYSYSFGTLNTVDVVGDGLQFLAESNGVLSGSSVAQQGNQVYTSGGERLDLDTLTGSANCLDADARSPEPAIDVRGDRIYGAQTRNGALVVFVCDQLSGAINRSAPLQAFGGRFESPQKILAVSANRLVVQLFDRIVIVEQPELP